MQTYHLVVWRDGKSQRDVMKAANIDNLRKNIIAKYRGKKDAIVEVSVFFSNIGTNLIGRMYMTQNNGYEWASFNRNAGPGVQSISPQTGKLRRV